MTNDKYKEKIISLVKSIDDNMALAKIYSFIKKISQIIKEG